MDAILDLPPTLPPHDAAPLAAAPHRVVAEWPEGTFLENLVVLPDGAVIVSVLSEGRLDRVTADGTVATLRQFPTATTGLALTGGGLFVAVGEPGRANPELWRLDPATGAGERWMTLGGLEFANGVTPFAPSRLLVAESWQGRLVLVDLAARRCETWFADDRLTRAPGVEFLPGANGVKRFGTEVTVSSNGRALLLTVDVAPDGSAGRGHVRAERLRADDFAYDHAGDLYLATHIGHSVDRLGRDGTRAAIAGPAQGTAGATACAFAPDGALYVTTTGGLLAPPDRTLQRAKLVRIETGVRGHPLDAAWEG